MVIIGEDQTLHFAKAIHLRTPTKITEKKAEIAIQIKASKSKSNKYIEIHLSYFDFFFVVIVAVALFLFVFWCVIGQTMCPWERAIFRSYTTHVQKHRAMYGTRLVRVCD